MGDRQFAVEGFVQLGGEGDPLLERFAEEYGGEALFGSEGVFHEVDDTHDAGASQPFCWRNLRCAPLGAGEGSGCGRPDRRRVLTIGLAQTFPLLVIDIE